ncbi:hypothetical protein BH23ACT2_BH23ACT2_03700 [soil metagenome]
MQHHTPFAMPPAGGFSFASGPVADPLPGGSTQ